MLVQGEQIFTVPANSFAVGGTASGFTLAYSADGLTYTEWEKETPANETLVVNGVAKGMRFKLLNNTGETYIQF